jgi:hypothetical protein
MARGVAWLSVGVDEAARFDVMVYSYCVGEEESMAPGGIWMQL